jgi:signal transduction histidine kinase
MELERAGLEVDSERVDTADAMKAALDRRTFELIVADYSMPRFSAPAALEIVQKKKLDVPFIIVSGTVNDEIAVEMMRAGAHDFMAKGSFVRLVPAIERELREAALRAERTSMQEQLLISERMASVGSLAAGVAHEINNPLAALVANLDFISEDVTALAQDARSRGLDPRLVERLEALDPPLQDAREAADRVRRIVRDLKVFSRADEDRTGPVDVHAVIDSSLRLAWNEIRHRARVVREYGDVPAVEGNEGRLGQVFLNLVVNAAQAITEGHAEQNEIRIVTKLDPNGRVVVEVRDTGSGIPSELASRIFDPFFTTKPVGVGTGLGLTICHRIVTALGGDLIVESEVGVGSVFRTVLPVACAPRSERPPASVVGESTHRAKILVVDDEAALGAILQRMLSPAHDVLAVTSGRAALQRLEHEWFDVIFCDLMMPDVTGMDLHAELARTSPAQADRMVFMTGGAFTRSARDFLDRVPNQRIEKPFNADSVRRAVYELVR